MVMERHVRLADGLRLGFEVVLMGLAYLLYRAVRVLVEGDSRRAFDHAMQLISLERRLGIFLEPDLQRQIIDDRWLVEFLNAVYLWGFLPVIVAAGLYLFVWHRTIYARYRNAFLLSGAFGLVVFAALPVAPPRMLPEFGFVDTVNSAGGFYDPSGEPGFINQFAAMPSFHFGWTLLLALALIQAHHNPAIRIAALALPVVMLVSIVLTANHYVVDAAAGAIIVLVALGVVCLLERRCSAWGRTLAALGR